MSGKGGPVDPRLTRLVALTTALRQAKLAQLAQGNAEATRVRAQIAALDRPPASDSQTTLAAQAQAEARYRIWSDRRRDALNLALAQAMARTEAAREEAGRALGRDEALKTLINRAAGRR